MQFFISQSIILSSKKQMRIFDEGLRFISLNCANKHGDE